tara:strand:+ start:2927 stop:3061 length:135 start_codon:yes stop_codon:yes gene_type:complete
MLIYYLEQFIIYFFDATTISLMPQPFENICNLGWHIAIYILDLN